MNATTIEAYVDAAAALLDLPIAPAYRFGVLRYFALAGEQASLVAAVPLGSADEAAAVFVPVGPGDLPEG